MQHLSCGSRRHPRLSAGFRRCQTWHSSFTAWTTGVSNPVRSPRFRTSASVLGQVVAFATGVPPDIYAFHRYTRNSTTPSQTQVNQYPGQCSR
eukprot:jgi/Botrbrau1/21371/Bobra.0618s0001.1